MVRLSGVVISDRKHICVSLQSIFGVGKTRALNVCTEVGIDPTCMTSSLSQDVLNEIQSVLRKYEIEGDLRRRISVNIKRLKDIKCYRGMRHRLSLPVRGQRTKTNAMTRKKRKKF